MIRVTSRGTSSVLKYWRDRARVRPWIAVAMAYALALQMLVAGVAAGRMAADGALAQGELSLICHTGDNGKTDPADTGDGAAHQMQCALCVLAQAPHAILGSDHPYS